MKLIEILNNYSIVFLTLIIIIISACIIIVTFNLYNRLKSRKETTRATVELNKITNNIRAGLIHFILEDDCRIIYASKGFYELLGYDEAEDVSKKTVTLSQYVDVKDKYFYRNIREQLSNEMIRCEIRMITKSGAILYGLMYGSSTTGHDGKHTISVVLVDITEQKQMQELILLEGERYRIAAELSKDVLFEYHIRNDEMIYNERMKDLFGISTNQPDFIKNYTMRRDIIHPDDWGIFLELCQELAEGKSIIEAEFRMKDRLGEFIWCQLMGKTIFDDDKRPIRVIGKLVNVDAQKRELEAFEFKATRDPLTGVYNKEVTIKKIDKFISGNKNGKHMLMFIDFDNFKSINDTYGHLQGDKVLSFVISKIKSIFSEGEIIGRIGGDEFVVFSGNIKDIEDVMYRAEILRNALDTTYVSNMKTIPISGSIGIAIYPEAGLHYEQLMDRADQALYRVKEQGKNNFMLYTPTT